MASANFRKSSSQHQSFLVKNVEVAVEHTCHPCPLYINLWHWYFQHLPTVFPLRIQSSDWRPSGKIMSAPASTYAAACTDWANLRMQIDAVKCCQCFSLVIHTASFLSSMNVWGRCSFHSLVETFTRPGWWESDFRKETSQSEWSFDYCQMSTLIWYAVYRLAYNHHLSYLDCIERDRGNKSTPTPKMQSFAWGWCQLLLDISWWQV